MYIWNKLMKCIHQGKRDTAVWYHSLLNTNIKPTMNGTSTYLMKVYSHFEMTLITLPQNATVFLSLFPMSIKKNTTPKIKNKTTQILGSKKSKSFLKVDLKTENTKMTYQKTSPQQLVLHLILQISMHFLIWV